MIQTELENPLITLAVGCPAFGVTALHHRDCIRTWRITSASSRLRTCHVVATCWGRFWESDDVFIRQPERRSAAINIGKTEKKGLRAFSILPRFAFNAVVHTFSQRSWCTTKHPAIGWKVTERFLSSAVEHFAPVAQAPIVGL